MNRTPKDFQVGQKLWEWDTERRAHIGREITVSKVGRDWVYFDDGRSKFDPKIGMVHSQHYSPYKRVFESLEARNEYVDGENIKAEVIESFQAAISHKSSDWFTAEIARQILDVINAAKEGKQ